jgi:hypothetical protein
LPEEEENHLYDPTFDTALDTLDSTHHIMAPPRAPVFPTRMDGPVFAPDLMAMKQ